MKASQIGERNTEKIHNYNLRSSRESLSIQIMAKSSENSSDELERTLTPDKTTEADLRELVSQLQMSLASSEKEQLQLQDLISRQQAVFIQPIINTQNTEAVSVNAPAVSTVADLNLNASYSTLRNVSFDNTYTAASIDGSANANVNRGAFANGTYTMYNSAHMSPIKVYASNGFRTSASLYTSSANGDFVSQPSPFPHTNVNTSSWNVTSTGQASINPATGYASSHVAPTVPIVSFSQSPLGLAGHPPTRKVHDLPEFHGSPEEWPMFSVAFRETSTLYAYTDLENLLRMQKALKGKARQQVESLLIHPSNVNAAMNTLAHHYGRPELLVRSQIAKARAYPAVTSGKISDIIHFSTMVTNLTAFLESSGATFHLNNPILLDELLSKLPFNKREEWTRHLLTLRQPYPTVRNFCNWLQQVALYVSMATDVMPTKQFSSNEQLNLKSKTATKTVFSISKDDQKCLLCSENHNFFQCKKFKALDYSARWSTVKKHNLYFACLQSGHNLQQCHCKNIIA